MKAIGLLSGGLDSTLAVRMVVDQGIDVIAVKFTSPFCQCDSGGCCHAAVQAQRMGVPLKTVAKGDDYLDVVRHPPHGWGSAMNPCIDCRIFMFRKTKAYMEEIGAAFLFTGEVLGQRPMSQHRRAMRQIEQESGLEGKIVRPLSAQHFPPTEAEVRGWIDREKLLAITGRSRKEQITLAAQLDIRDYPCPAGGCLLTDASFSARLRDLFAHQKQVSMQDVRLLKIGRHFRFERTKVVCGRDQGENDALGKFQATAGVLLEAIGCAGPTVLLPDAPNDAMLRFAATVAAAYSRATVEEVTILCRTAGTEKTIMVPKLDRSMLTPFLV